ncbi:hypothetical protein ACHAXT_010735 [Thalassiosira profunda]
MDQAGEREVVRNADGTALVDHKGKPVAVERFLCTKPLRTEVSTRKGPGGMKLSYMGGDMVTKTLNEAFGYDGWSLEVKDTTREEPILDDKKRYHVAYIATVRITHRRSGAYREDCGAGDSIDRSLATASSHAVKGAVTDAMKRAARHFGEKLGNSLYHDGFNANNAPPTLKDALDALDIDRAKSRFGFEKDRKAIAGQGSAGVVHSAKAPVHAHQAAARNNNAPGGSAKQEATKAATRAPYAQQQTPRTQYVGGVVFESNQKKAEASKPHVTPYHPGATTAARNATTAPATNRNGGGPASTTKNGAASFDASLFAAVPAAKLAAGGAKENSNPQTGAPPPPPKPGGLALPPRPGTSRRAQPSPTSAYIANFAGAGGSDAGDAPPMFGAGGTMSQALASQQAQSQPPPPPGTSIAQSLKRKNEEASAGVVAKAPNTGARNPYNC